MLQLIPQLVILTLNPARVVVKQGEDGFEPRPLQHLLAPRSILMRTEKVSSEATAYKSGAYKKSVQSGINHISE